MDTPRSRTFAALAVLGVAVVLAVVDRGPVAGPTGPGRPAPSDASAAPAAPVWAAEVEAGADHLDADTFVRTWLERPDAYLVVDVRPADEFAAWHLPGAHRLDLVALLGPEGDARLRVRGDRTVVLVSHGMTHPAQAWVELRRRGHAGVRVLEDGLAGLLERYGTPTSLQGPATARRVAEEAALGAAFRARALGRPAPLPAGAARWATDPAELTEPTVVSVAWLAVRLGKVAVLDTREKAEEVGKGRVPGAVHVPIAATRETRGGVADELLAPAALAAKAGTWGLTADTPVVVLGGDRLQDPTHLVLALVALGHRKVAVLEGGFPAWARAGLPVTTQAPAPAAATYVPRPGAFDFGVDLDAVAAASRGGGPRILDVRPTKAFEGEQGTEVRGGRIPGSVSRPYTEDVVAADGAVWWRDAATLRAGYAGAGLGSDAPVIVSCRTGHQASLAWFTLRVLLGYKDVRWFDGSFKAWSLRADLPVETGPAKRP